MRKKERRLSIKPAWFASTTGLNQEHASKTHGAIDYSTVCDGLQEELQNNFVHRRESAEKLANMEFSILSGALSSLSLDRNTYINHLERLRDCGTILQFEIDESGRRRLKSANFCKSRLCPMCTWRRSLKVFSQVSRVMTVVESMLEHYDFIFLTLTVRNCPLSEYQETLDLINKGWRNLQHRIFERDPYKGVIAGTIRAIETTVNKKGTVPLMHPHIHVILAVTPKYYTEGVYTSTRGFVKLWRRACGLDYDPVCWVERIRPKFAADEVAGSGGGRTYANAVAEISKYSVKDSDYLPPGVKYTVDDLRLIDTLLAGLWRRRLFAMSGVFRKTSLTLGLDDPESGDLVTVDDEELRPDLVALIARCYWRYGCYVVEIEKCAPDSGRLASNHALSEAMPVVDPVLSDGGD